MVDPHLIPAIGEDLRLFERAEERLVERDGFPELGRISVEAPEHPLAEHQVVVAVRNEPFRRMVVQLIKPRIISIIRGTLA